MFILEIIKVLVFTFFEMMKAFVISFIEFIPTISFFSKISNAFSYSAIICGLIGIPVSLAFVVRYLLKQASKRV